MDSGSMVAKAEVYYCTSEGKVYGELQIYQNKVMFVPKKCAMNEQFVYEVEESTKKKKFERFKPKQTLSLS